jgi:hypothetical protein
MGCPTNRQYRTGYVELSNNTVNFLNVSGREGSGESETKHWLEMLANPSVTLVQWHRLKAEARSQGRKTVHRFVY